ncbi:MAG TPA: hypothetical protein VK738_05355 [Terriglobales bacterium]|jgi:hypothetical protein|nr:hypothetical protein [Terriglobales bacterium]
MGSEPEILSPGKELGPILPLSTWQKYKPVVVISSFSLFGGGLAVWGFSQFLQARGFTSVVGSRIFLALACLGVSGIAFVWTRLLRKSKNAWFAGSLLVIVVAALALDRFIPMPQVSTIISSSPYTRPSDWRTIKDWQKSEITAILEQYPNHTLHIVASSVSDETWDYANQFKELFLAHQWKVIGPETGPEDQIPLNVQLSISEQYWGGKQRPDAFTSLDSVLQFIHIKTTPNFVVDPLVSPDELVM